MEQISMIMDAAYFFEEFVRPQMQEAIPIMA